MDPSNAEELIRSRVSVTRQRITISKALVLNSSISPVTCDELMQLVLDANGVSVPRPIVIHESVDTSATLIAVSELISWRLATIEAIWSLIYSGLLIALSESRSMSLTIDWTTVVPGCGGMSSGWRFEEYELWVPGKVKRTPSSLIESNQFLTEPDLYLHTLAVSSLHPDIAAAFQEAVRCFRLELFTASLAMLGKASEGSWLELGKSLLCCIPIEQTAKFAKQRDILEDPMLGPYKKIEAVLTIYSHQEYFASISQISGIRLQELRSASAWSDIVRDSRNTIHFGVTPQTPNTYEKLAVLLLGAVIHIRTLYCVKDAADAVSRNK